MTALAGSALDPYTWANDLLDVCVAALDTLPDEPAVRPLLGAPARVFLADGEPPYECPDFLSIHMQASAEADTTPVGTQRVKVGRVNLPMYVISIIRCRPGSMGKAKTPPVEDYNTAARQHMADLWVLWNAVWRKVAAGVLFSGCDGVVIGIAQAEDPMGLVSGWQIFVSPSMDGYDPIPGYGETGGS